MPEHKMTQEDLDNLAANLEAIGALDQVNRWLARGDGVAVYQNHDLSHPERGSYQYASYGSEQAQLETDDPPERLPDIGGAINWRYTLIGTYRGPALKVTAPTADGAA